MNYMEPFCHTVALVVCILRMKAPLRRWGRRTAGQERSLNERQQRT